jgi:hypothetical protein
VWVWVGSCESVVVSLFLSRTVIEKIALVFLRSSDKAKSKYLSHHTIVLGN